MTRTACFVAWKGIGREEIDRHRVRVVGRRHGGTGRRTGLRTLGVGRRPFSDDIGAHKQQEQLATDILLLGPISCHRRSGLLRVPAQIGQRRTR
jgi:hypothetical protein